MKKTIKSPLILTVKDAVQSIENGWKISFIGKKRVLENSKTIFIPKRIVTY